jgi:hypothetical protein
MVILVARLATVRALCVLMEQGPGEIQKKELVFSDQFTVVTLITHFAQSPE